MRRTTRATRRCSAAPCRTWRPSTSTPSTREGATPPEAVDERSDLYALGLILFEMIAGEHPFPEPPPACRAARDDPRDDRAAPTTPVPSLRERTARRSPGAWTRWSRKCLDPDPARRYARARDLAEDLRRFLDDLPMKHSPEPSLRGAAGASGPGASRALRLHVGRLDAAWSCSA